MAMKTHELIKELTHAGMPEKQAELLARHQIDILEENFAIKIDLELLRKDLIIKLGAMFIAAIVAIIGIILAVLPQLIHVH